MLRGFASLLVIGVCVAGCGLTPKPTEPSSIGSANRGWLAQGHALPARGLGFVRARVGDDTRFGTPVLVSALTRAAALVEQNAPGGAPLAIGDLSARDGGHHARHGSHRSGRDVDVLFYLVDASGYSVRGSGY